MTNNTTPLVSIYMGSASDMPIMRKAAEFLNTMQIPFEIHALSAHRTPNLVAQFASEAEERGVKVIIAGVPIKSSNSIEGLDSLLSILQMPSGIPVATVAVDGAQNAAILATQVIAQSDKEVLARLHAFKTQLAEKVVKANDDLQKEKFDFRVN